MMQLRFKSVLFTFILPVIGVGLVASCYKKATNPNMFLCSQPYALCTSALCIPLPDDHTKAICYCDVEEGKSMSTVPCDTIMPSTDPNGIRTIYSTFSLKQMQEGKKGMKCPSGTPWSWCLNKRCTVDPTNPKRAICQCDVVRSSEWMTFGGDCNTTTCATGYWSGAKVKDNDDGIEFLAKALGLKTSPFKWCQADSP